MKLGRLYLESDQQLIFDRVMLTTSPLERMRGLLGRPEPADNEGLLIEPCSSIHTLGMRYSIDVIFLSRDWRILKLVSDLGSLRMAWCVAAHRVLETRAHGIARWQLEPEMKLAWEDS